MPRTVTLLRNPMVDTQANPRRRRRRRNPAMDVGAITKQLPDWTVMAAGLGGAAVAAQVPHMFKATGWTNVVWSAVFTVGGSFLLQMFLKDRNTTTGFATGGAVITLAKALHVATKGGFGLDPGMRFVKPTAGVGAGLPAYQYYNYQPQYAQPALPPATAAPSLPAPAPDIGALRESDFYQGMENEPLLV